MANVEAVIFDYYETLVELNRETRSLAFDDLARRVGAELAPGEAFRHWQEHTQRDWQLRLGGQQRPPLDGETMPFVSFREVWTKRMAQLFAHWGVEAAAAVGYAAYRDAHAHARIYGEAPAALGVLRARYRLAVLSDADSDFLQTSIARHGLTFETVVSSEDVRAYKPHVSIFRETCGRLGVAPEAAVYVGDSAWADVAGARHAGLGAVWVNRHALDWPPDIDPPGHMVLALDELPALLEDLP